MLCGVLCVGVVRCLYACVLIVGVYRQLPQCYTSLQVRSSIFPIRVHNPRMHVSVCVRVCVCVCERRRGLGYKKISFESTTEHRPIERKGGQRDSTRERERGGEREREREG